MEYRIFQRSVWSLVLLAFFLVSCAPAAPAPTATLVPSLTPTLTFTPTPLPTSTPTITPTPVGGGTGKFVFQYFKNAYEKEFPDLKGGSNLFMVNWDGSELTPLTNGLLDGSDFVDLSPDGTKALLFSIPPLYTAIEGTSVLYVMDLTVQDPQPVKLASGIWDFLRTALWLDNSRVIFLDQVPGGWAVFTINSDGTNKQRISQRVNGITPRELTLTADRSRFFWLGVDTSTRGWNHKGIWWTSMDGSEQSQLLQINRNGPFSAYNSNGISPDGSMIVWQKDSYSGPVLPLYFATTSDIDVYNAEKVNVPDKFLWYSWVQMFWSPDSSMVLFNRPAEKYNDGSEYLGQVFAFYPKDKTVREIKFNSDPIHPVIDFLRWSPDGRSVLVSANGWKGGSVRKILDLETGAFTPALTNLPSQDGVGRIFWLP